MSETVEVAISLPKEVYESIQKAYTLDICGELHDKPNIYQAIVQGTILQKGHGRLIDADNMKHIDAIQRGDFNSIESIRAWIDIMPTVIEADKESENNE